MLRPIPVLILAGLLLTVPALAVPEPTDPLGDRAFDCDLPLERTPCIEWAQNTGWTTVGYAAASARSADGRVLYMAMQGYDLEERLGEYPFPEPAGRIYVAAMDLETSDVLWYNVVGPRGLDHLPQDALLSADGSRFFVLSEFDGGCSVDAIDTSTGASVWRHTARPSTNSGYTCPTLAPSVDHTRLHLAGSVCCRQDDDIRPDAHVRTIDAATGALVAASSFDLGYSGPELSGATALEGGDVLVSGVVTERGHSEHMYVARTAPDGSHVWETLVPDCCYGDEVSDPLLSADGTTAYVASHIRVAALDVATGTLGWSQALPNGSEAPYSGIPAAQILNGPTGTSVLVLHRATGDDGAVTRLAAADGAVEWQDLETRSDDLGDLVLDPDGTRLHVLYETAGVQQPGLVLLTLDPTDGSTMRSMSFEGDEAYGLYPTPSGFAVFTVRDGLPVQGIHVYAVRV